MRSSMPCFAWMSGTRYEAAALPVSEALFTHLAWLVPVSEALMLPPYLCWCYLLLRRGSVFPRWMALSNPLVLYGVLKATTIFMPSSASRLAFINGLTSESMALWFGSMLVWNKKYIFCKRGRHRQ